MRDQQAPVMTTSDEPFLLSDSKIMAIQVLKRFGNDISAATNAWRRLLQNNCSESDFKALVDTGDSETTYVAKVLIQHGEHEETSMCLVKAQEEQAAGRLAIDRYSREKLEWMNDCWALDCHNEVGLKLEGLQPISAEHAKILSTYL